MTFPRAFTAILALLLAPVCACAQSPAPKPAGILPAARKLMEKARYCALITIGPDGRAESRIIDAFAPEPDMTVWLATSTVTRKVEQIRKDPRVTLFYWDQASMGYVTIIGDATLVSDAAEKAKRWKEDWAKFYSDKNRGPDYLLVRVTPRRLEVVSLADGLVNDPKTWRPLQHEFQAPHQHHPPASAGEYAKILENPSRDIWQMPHEVLMALGLKSTDTVADIGAGTGYFTRRLARHAGKVYAVDIDKNLLAKAGKEAPPNVEMVLAAPDDPRLPPQSVDMIFFCDVLHHIENRPAYYAKLAKALKPGGRIVVIDFHKKELPVGPPPSMKLSDEEVVAEFDKAGFALSKRLEFLPYQYFLFFEKR